MKMIGAATLVFVMILTGCGGTSNSKIPPGNLSGNWQMTLASSSSSETQSGFLLQSGTTISGSLLFSGQTISGQVSCASVGSVLGQLSGGNLTITESPAGQTINLTGTPATNFSSMAGNYSIFASGCGQTEVGTWTATQVSPLTGNFGATFTLAGSNDFHFLGTITQGSNTGDTNATLSGTMTSADSPCFTSATLAGVISGTTVVINLLTSDGVTLGKFSGATTTDATSVTGGYKFSNASDPTALGSCEGFGGNTTITIQAPPTT